MLNYLYHSGTPNSLEIKLGSDSQFYSQSPSFVSEWKYDKYSFKEFEILCQAEYHDPSEHGTIVGLHMLFYGDFMKAIYVFGR